MTETGRVLIAADKFKGSLTATEVAARVTAGIHRVRPDADVAALPVADGGDGTVDAAVAAGFTPREAEVTGPLGLPVTARYAVRGGTAVVEVRDTGQGITPAELERIWEPFWQADRPGMKGTIGSGLGLGITRRLVRNLGGEIGVASEPGSSSG